MAGDSGLGDSPRQTSKLDNSDAHPELGRRLSISGRRLRVGRLRPETPVPRGRRLRSVWLGFGLRNGSDDSDARPELGQRLLSLAGDSGPGVT
jgi:hypothetical protein